MKDESHFLPLPTSGPTPPVRPAKGGSERLARLKATPRRPGEASFFWYEPQFGNEAVKVLPGEYFVEADDILIMTTLGSCIACCLWDSRSRVGGLNHFLLPDGGDDYSGRYGLHAMQRLIDAMLARGASRARLEAKVFGGAHIIAGCDSMSVGQRNTTFVLDYLRAERIPVLSQDVLGTYARKVCFLPASGKAMVKRLGSTHPYDLVEHERAAARRLATPQPAAGPIESF